MTLKQIIKSVRDLLDDDQYPRELITEAANWVQDELFNDTKTRLMQTSTQIDVLPGENSIDLPDDFQQILSLYVTSPQVWNLGERIVPYQDFIKQYPLWETSSPTGVNIGTLFGQTIRLSAPVLSPTAIAFDYMRKPEPMVRDNDVCEIPDNYSEIISRGTLARVLERDQEYDEARAERENIAPLVTAFKAREGLYSGNGRPMIIRPSRRRGRTDSWRD